MKEQLNGEREPACLSHSLISLREPVYLSESVQSVQSDRKRYKSRINIGVSSEPISKIIGSALVQSVQWHQHSILGNPSDSC